MNVFIYFANIYKSRLEANICPKLTGNLMTVKITELTQICVILVYVVTAKCKTLQSLLSTTPVLVNFAITVDQNKQNTLRRKVKVVVKFLTN